VSKCLRSGTEKKNGSKSASGRLDLGLGKGYHNQNMCKG
jgi:hypothetical protein